MRRYHGPIKYMSNFKAVQIDYEYYLTLSNEPQSICLTERQMYVLSVQNTYTAWFTRWYNTDDITEKTVQYIAAEIEDLLMCGCGIPEPSITDRFNAQSYITTTGDTYETTYNTWNDAGQTVASIAPNLDYSSGSTIDKDKLLCLALNMLLINIVEAAKANKQGTSQQNRDMVKNMGNVFGGMAVAGGAATAAGGAAAGFVAFIGGPYLILGLALTAVGLAIANLVWTTDISVFTDDEAIEHVRCTLSRNILGATPTRPRFQAGLVPNDFASGSNAEKLAAIVQPYLDDLDTYLQWLATANGLYEVADFGLLEECEICPILWTHEFDFTDNDGGFASWGAFSTGVAGTWSAGVGWVSGFVTGGGFAYQMVQINRVIDPTRITGMIVTYNMTNGMNAGLTRLLTTDTLTFASTTDIPSNGSGQTYSGVGVADASTYVGLRVQAGNQSGSSNPGGTCTVTHLTVTGEGIDPFL